MLYPPLASSVLSSQWNPSPPTKDSIYPSGAVVDLWDQPPTVNYLLAATWNNYEDPRYRSSFDEDALYVNPVGVVDWLVDKYTYGSQINDLNILVDPKTSNTSTSLYKLLPGQEGVVANGTYWLGFGTSTIFDHATPQAYVSQGYFKEIYKIDENGNLEGTHGSKKIPIFRLSYNHLNKRQVYDAFSRPDRLDGQPIAIINKESGGNLPSVLNALSSNSLLKPSSFLSIIFREYVHYVGNPLGGTGLLDLTPFTVSATTYVERNLKTDIYSPYSVSSMDLVIDYNNQLPIHLWPKTYLTGLTP